MKTFRKFYKLFTLHLFLFLSPSNTEQRTFRKSSPLIFYLNTLQNVESQTVSSFKQHILHIAYCQQDVLLRK